jgi:predicted metalloendopeptidase
LIKNYTNGNFEFWLSLIRDYFHRRYSDFYLTNMSMMKAYYSYKILLRKGSSYYTKELNLEFFGDFYGRELLVNKNETLWQEGYSGLANTLGWEMMGMYMFLNTPLKSKIMLKLMIHKIISVMKTRHLQNNDWLFWN